MTEKKLEEFELIRNDRLNFTDLTQLFDTGCIREPLIFGLKTINSSMLDESLDITLFGYNPTTNNKQRFAVAELKDPFFSLGM